jgi:hypothetical protein
MSLITSVWEGAEDAFAVGLREAWQPPFLLQRAADSFETWNAHGASGSLKSGMLGARAGTSGLGDCAAGWQAATAEESVCP